jgi:hypothetical protein
VNVLLRKRIAFASNRARGLHAVLAATRYYSREWTQGREGVFMPKLFRSLFFIGAIYAMSPVDDGLSLIDAFTKPKTEAGQTLSKADQAALAAEAAKAMASLAPEHREIVTNLIGLAGTKAMAQATHARSTE